jgi:hypothetical protein
MSVHLILDAASVHSASAGVTFHLNPATKHPENPVLLPGLPHEWDSLNVTWPGTVLHSPRDGKFRCWYGGLDVVQGPGRHWRFGYAESDDGVNWVKPKLGQVEFLGRDTNQLKPDWVRWPANVPVPEWGTYMLSLVFENPIPGAPESQRFGAYWIETQTTDDGLHRWMVKALAWSPDGVRWTRHSTAHEVTPYKRVNFHDINHVLYDAGEPDPDFRVKAYSQFQRPLGNESRTRRQVGFLHGRAFDRVEPAAEPIALAPVPEIEDEIHFNTVRKIGSQYVMLFESDRFSRAPLNGDIRLAVSADGRKFRRVHPGAPVVATGGKGEWDANALITTTSAMQEVGDELWIYYFGVPRVFNCWPTQYEVVPGRRGSLFYPACLGLATLPRDRFASAQGEGVVTTNEVVLSDDGLWLNADGEGIVVGVVGASSGEGRLTDERRQTVYRRVRWSGQEPRGTCRLEIRLPRRSELYALSC